MRHWLLAFFIGCALVLGTAAAAYQSQFLVDPVFLTGDMLAPDHRSVPERVLDYLGELRKLWSNAAGAAAAAVVCGYLLWSFSLLFLRPNGPGQASRLGNKIVWSIFLVSTAMLAFGASFYVLGMDQGLVDPEFRNNFSVVAAVCAVMAYWLATLFGTEPLMRPGVPLGHFLTRLSR
jgi:hypothetical protein